MQGADSRCNKHRTRLSEGTREKAGDLDASASSLPREAVLVVVMLGLGFRV